MSGTIEDIGYRLSNPNQLGRSQLIALNCNQFFANANIVGATAAVQLPQPAPGVVRKWMFLTIQPSALVAGDLVQLVWANPNTVLWSSTNNNDAGPLPLIGCFRQISGANVWGIQNNFYLTTFDLLVAQVTFAVPGAQTIAVSGRFFDAAT